MLVDPELRERLSLYCMVSKQTQEKAANSAIRQMLNLLEHDPEMSKKMLRAAQLKQDLQNL